MRHGLGHELGLGRRQHPPGLRGLIAAVAPILLLVVAACGGTGSQGSSSASSPTPNKPTWALGAMTDLTGPGSNAGGAQQKGMNF